MEFDASQRSAFAAIVGRPNVGKSSILNKLIGEKVAIVSSKPQTTRTRIIGVLTEGNDQLVFLDTPGIHKPKNSLGSYMMKSVSESVAGVDLVVFVTEACTPVRDSEKKLIEKIRSFDLPCVLVLNKTDLPEDMEGMLQQISEYTELMDFDAVIPISAKTGDNMDVLKAELKKFTMEGGHLFPDDAVTDQPEKVIAAEIVREKILRLTDKEIPHGVAVVIEKMKPRANQEITDIDAVIYCEKESHKGILIGKKGSMLKKISSSARIDMEKFFNCKINLQTWIKVKEDWRNRENLMRTFGFDKNDFQ